MPEHAVTKKLTEIAAHVRGGKAVRGYRAERLQALGTEDVGKSETVGIEEFQQKYNEVDQHIYDENGDLFSEVPTNELEIQAKRLFSLSNKSGVDPIIHSHDQFVSNIYDGWAQKVNTPVDFANANSRNAFDMLLDKDNITSIIKSTDALQRKFQEDLDLDEKPQRIDPFTFSFNVREYISLGNTELSGAVIEHMTDQAEKIIANNPHAFTSTPPAKGTALDYARLMFGTKMAFDKKTKKVDKLEQASVILSSIKGQNAPQLSKESMDALQSYLAQNHLAGFSPLKDLKSDEIANIMTKKLRASDIQFDGKSEIARTFKLIDTGAILPALNFIRTTGIIPTFMAGDRGVISDVYKSIDGINKILASGESLAKKTIYVSRNPMNILTMSPENSCGSCQSLTLNGKPKLGPEAQLGEGEHELATNAINIPASYNTQSTNDFIMYTLDDAGQKNARMSLTYDSRKDRFISFEELSIYGIDRESRATIRSFVSDRMYDPEKNPEGKFDIKQKGEVYVDDIKDYVPIQNEFHGLETKMVHADRDFDSLMSDEAYDEAKEVFGGVKDAYDNWNSKKEDAADSFFDGVNDMYSDLLDKDRSLLYDSPAYSLVKGAKAVTDLFRKDFKNLNSMYSDTYSYMKQKLSLIPPD